MTDIDDNGYKTETKDILPYLLLIGVAGIGFNLYYKYDRYYLGEKLIEKQIVISDPPEYVNAGKGGTDRYTFSGKNFQCRFWLSQGALKKIKSNYIIKNEIESINSGDSIEIKIRQTDELSLQDTKARPRVIEFSRQNRTIISASQVQEEDKKWFYINFGVPILCLIIWIILQVKRQIKRRNEIL